MSGIEQLGISPRDYGPFALRLTLASFLVASAASLTAMILEWKTYIAGIGKPAGTDFTGGVVVTIIATLAGDRGKLDVPFKSMVSYDS